MVLDIIDKAMSVFFCVTLFSSVIYQLYFYAFPHSENIRKKGGRLNMYFSGSLPWNAKDLIREYIEPKRQGQAHAIYQISMYSFISLMVLFIFSMFINA